MTGAPGVKAVGLRFKGAPSYAYEEKSCKAWSVKGTWNVSGMNLVLAPSSAASKTIDLATSTGQRRRAVVTPRRDFVT